MLTVSLDPRFEARTIGDSVYLNLREAILSLGLKPGEELSIKEVAEALHISRSPVRDALMRLSSESLVEIFPQRGCRVSLIDLARVRQELFLREGLEVLALSRFLDGRTENDMEKLEAAIRKQEQDIASGDQAGLIEHDDDFHSVFFEATGQHYAQQVLTTYCAHYRRIRMLSAYDESIAGGIVREHRDILRAIRRKDSTACLALETTHLNRLDAQLDGLRDAYPHYFLEERRDFERKTPL